MSGASGFDWLLEARTLLFVPGDRPDRFAKAAASGADAIVLDLEDAVSPASKDAARHHVHAWRAAGGAGLVRINDPTTTAHREDLASLGDYPLAVVMPKVSSPADVESVLSQLPTGSCVVPLFERALGVLEAQHICAVPGVLRAAFGSGDLARELGVDHEDWAALKHARSTIVLASAAAQIAPPIDGVTTAIDDPHALCTDTRRAAALGFSGKLCIHPGQIPLVHEALAPSHELVQWARRIVASDRGCASVVDGHMIDKAVVERARKVLARVGVSAVGPSLEARNHSILLEP